MTLTEELTAELIEAILENDLGHIAKLLNDGADPNHSLDDAKVTPLHFAAQNNALKAIAMLIEAGANPNAKTEDGLSPIQIAAYHKHDKAVQLLTAYINDMDLYEN